MCIHEADEITAPSLPILLCVSLSDDKERIVMCVPFRLPEVGLRLSVLTGVSLRRGVALLLGPRDDPRPFLASGSSGTSVPASSTGPSSASSPAAAAVAASSLFSVSTPPRGTPTWSSASSRSQLTQNHSPSGTSSSGGSRHLRW